MIEKQFNHGTVGLPDHAFLSDTGKPSFEVLRRTLGFNRHDSRNLTHYEQLQKITVESFLARHVTRLTRASYLYIQAGIFRKKGLRVFVNSDRGVSWEAQVFDSLLPGWYLLDRETDGTALFDALDDADEAELRAWFQEYFPIHETGKEQKKSKKLSLGHSDGAEMEIGPESMLKCVAEVYLHLLVSLDAWQSSSAERKTALADVAFACFSVFGPSALQRAVDKVPALLDYYGFVRGVKKSSVTLQDEQLGAVLETAAPVMLPPPDVPSTLQDFYTQLFDLADKGRAAPLDSGIADELDALLRYFPVLKEEMGIVDDVVHDVFNAVVRRFIALGAGATLVDFDDADFIAAFKSAWFAFLDAQSRSPLILSYFDHLEASTTAAFNIHATALPALREQISDLSVRIAVCESECERAGFKERRELKNTIATLTKEKIEQTVHLTAMEEHALLSLLPSDMTMNDLPDGSQPLTLSAAHYHSTAVAALRARHAQDGSQFGDTAVAQSAPTRVLGILAVPAVAMPLATSPVIALAADAVVTALVHAPVLVTAAAVTPEPVKVAARSVLGLQQECAVLVVPSGQNPPAAEGSAAFLAPPLVAESARANDVMQEKLADAACHVLIDADDGVEVGDVTDYCSDAAEASARFALAHANQGVVPALLVENIALHWIEQGYLNFAYAALDVAQQVAWVDGSVLDQSLVRAAYFGLHVWPGDQSGISTIQKQLNFISHQLLEEFLLRRPGGKIVPYLIFCASFQATLFSGNYTNAPRLLAQVCEYFGAATQRMINDIVSFGNRGHHLDLESLRKQPQVEAEKNQMENLRLRLSDWRDRIINKQTGWAPVRKAMSACLTEPDFMLTMEAIERGGSANASTVQAFVDKYADMTEVSALIESQVAKVQNGAGVQNVERNARNWFQSNIVALREIGENWLVENRNFLSRSSDAQNFADRLLTQLRAVQLEFRERVARDASLEHRCGSRLALQCVTRLLDAIQGDGGVIWASKRINATFTLSADLFLVDGLKNDSEAQLHWFAAQAAHRFDLRAATLRAVQGRDFRLAQLLLMLRKDDGEDIVAELQEIKKQSDRERHMLRQKADRVRTMVHNAALVNLIEDDRAYQLTSDHDYLIEQINSLDALDSMRELAGDVDAWERDLLGRFAGEIARKHVSLDELLRKARVQLGEDAVSDAWLTQMNQALDSQNLPVAEEMLNQLESSIEDGSKVTVDDIAPNPYITGFLGAEKALCEAIERHRNPREIGKCLHGDVIAGLDFSSPQSDCIAVLETMAEWRSKPKKSMDKPFYEALVRLLEYIGFDVAHKALTPATLKTLGFEGQGARFKRASVTVKANETGRPFPLFEVKPGTASEINVILAFGDWSAPDLGSYLETAGLAHNRTLLVSVKPLTNAQRNEFAAFCKNDQATVFHLDPVIAAYMGSLPSNDKRLRNFLFLSAPWTYYNPYTQGDTRRPAPHGMRYGRQNDVQMLTQRGGAAIVFGGRQLGKTTILHEAERVFNKPEQNQHAFYLPMDRDMARLTAVSKDAWSSARERVWEEIYQALVKEEVGILPPKRALDLEAKIRAIGDEFKRDGRSRVLFCMDEIDPILKIDHANGFGIFRGISELVNQPNGRFKMVIAGLENVKRFEDSPNFPLPQLGSSLQVSILPTRDAMQLVNEPLRILGYEFEDALLAASILFTTNRHPGLIHIFCGELLRWMSKRHTGAVGAIKITANDVDRIARDPEVNRLIRNRFDMTLDLDKRYLVIIYGLINSQRSTGYFTSSQAKLTSEYWLPDVFKPMTEKTFEAFLEELVGLGVLRRNADGREFALRSVNILKLVGNQTEIEEKLLKTVEDMDFDDPMSGHVITDQDGAQHLSPLTFSDEKLLIGAGAAEVRAANDAAGMYSVAIVTGSEALGMDIDKLKYSLKSLGKFEKTRLVSHCSEYDIKHVTDAKLKGVAGFRALLGGFIQDNTGSAGAPLMLLVDIDGALPLSFTLDLIDIAHESATSAAKLRAQVRVLFLLKPKAVWQWESKSDLTREREQLQTFISLGRWSKTAMSYLLSHLGLVNTSEKVDQLLDDSQGWYYSLQQLVQERAKHPTAQDVSDLKHYVAFKYEKSRRLADFIQKTGMAEFDWAPGILRALATNPTFDADDLELIVMDSVEHYAGLDVGQSQTILRWFERLRLVDPVSTVRTSRGSIAYRVNPSVATALREVHPDGAMP